MVITFPHFGSTYIPIKILFDELGIEYIVPPLNSNDTLEIGTLYSPEEMCLPFKIMMGNYIQSIEEGADTIVLVGSNGPCRFGEYCELQKNILDNLGYHLDFIVLESPQVIGKEEFKSKVYKIVRHSSRSSTDRWRILGKSITVVRLMEQVENKVLLRNGYEVNKGEHKRILYQCKNELLKTGSIDKALSVLKYYNKRIEKTPVDLKKNPVKIALLGEIYTIIEPFSNFNIVDKLMDFGASVKKGLSVTWWLTDAFLRPLKLNSINIRKASMAYMPYYIGGHGRECVGEALLANKEKFDGAIQLFPMGCMPEIVAKVILQKISKDRDFPIMTLILDEMTGEAGYNTRIEAFFDLLERRQENVLFRC